MKNTATEWLFEKLWDSPKDKLTWNALLEEAKYIEKEQIQIAYDMGWHRANKTKDKAYITAEDFGENYFTKKYGK